MVLWAAVQGSVAVVGRLGRPCSARAGKPSRLGNATKIHTPESSLFAPPAFKFSLDAPLQTLSASAVATTPPKAHQQRWMCLCAHHEHPRPDIFNTQ